MLGWLCLIIELLILEELTQERDFWLGLPFVFGLWVNLHGSWPVGIVFLGIYLCDNWRAISWGSLYANGLTGQERKRLVFISGVSVLALFLNPYGWHSVVYPFVVITEHHLTVNTVEEWQSLDFHSFRGRLLFVMLAVLLWLKTVRKRRW